MGLREWPIIFSEMNKTGQLPNYIVIHFFKEHYSLDVSK